MNYLELCTKKLHTISNNLERAARREGRAKSVRDRDTAERGLLGLSIAKDAIHPPNASYTLGLLLTLRHLPLNLNRLNYP